MIIRRYQHFDFAGQADLGDNPNYQITRNGKIIHFRWSGSWVQHMTAGTHEVEIDRVRWMAHEYGHDLARPGTHSGWNHITNANTGVPANKRALGYTLMAGRSNTENVAADKTMSAFERDQHDGWISCTVLGASATNRVVRDLYQHNGCYKIPLTDGSGRELYVSNRQRIGYFDQYRMSTILSGGQCVPFEYGLLRTTGLLVGLRDGVNYNELVADNTLHSFGETGTPFANANDTFIGDLYTPTGPKKKVQVTPWTRPNINGYTTYPGGSAPNNISWQAITNIRYTGGPDGDMAFDYVHDFRTNPIVKADSWIGPESSGAVLTNDLVVEAGAILRINNTTLNFAPGKALKVYGILYATNSTLRSNSTWNGVYFASGSGGQLDGVVIQNVQAYGGAAVYITNASPTIRHSTINNCSGACNGIYVSQGNPFIYRNTLSGNSGHGIYLYQSNAYIVQNNITGTGLNAGKAGVYAWAYSNPLFGAPSHPYFEGRNTITNTNYAVYAGNGSSPNVGVTASLAYNNRLMNNTYDAYAASGADILAKYAYWGQSAGPNCCIFGSVTYSPWISSDPGPAFKGGEYQLSDRFVRAMEDRYMGDYETASNAFLQILSEDVDVRERRLSLVQIAMIERETGDDRLLALVRRYASQTGDELRVTAVELLMNRYFAASDLGEAQAFAEILIKEYRGTAHERNARLAQFYNSVHKRDFARASEYIAGADARFSGEEDVQAAKWLFFLEQNELGRKDFDADGTEDIAEYGTSGHELSATAYPNPFNSSVMIRYVQPADGNVTLDIFDVLGRRVRSLVNDVRLAGTHEVLFDASELPTGLYMYRVIANGMAKTGMVLLVR